MPYVPGQASSRGREDPHERRERAGAAAMDARSPDPGAVVTTSAELV